MDPVDEGHEAATPELIMDEGETWVPHQVAPLQKLGGNYFALSMQARAQRVTAYLTLVVMLVGSGFMMPQA